VRLLNNFSAGNYRLAFLQDAIESGLTAELLPSFFNGFFSARLVTMAEYLVAPPKVRNLELESIKETALSPQPADTSFFVTFPWSKYFALDIVLQNP